MMSMCIIKRVRGILYGKKERDCVEYEEDKNTMNMKFSFCVCVTI